MNTIKPETALPWVLSENRYVQKGNFCVADVGARNGPHKNAAYIVAACNAYPKLVEAMRVVLAGEFGQSSAGKLAAGTYWAKAEDLLRELGETK